MSPLEHPMKCCKCGGNMWVKTEKPKKVGLEFVAMVVMKCMVCGYTIGEDKQLFKIELTWQEAIELRWMLPSFIRELDGHMLEDHADSQMSSGKGNISKEEVKEYLDYLDRTFTSVYEKLEEAE